MQPNLPSFLNRFTTMASRSAFVPVLLSATVLLSSVGTTNAYGEFFLSWLSTFTDKVSGIGARDPAYNVPNVAAVQTIYKGYEVPDKWGYKYPYNTVRDPGFPEQT